MMWDVRDQIGDDAPEYKRPRMNLTEWRRFARDQIEMQARYAINSQPYRLSSQPARDVLAIARHAPGPMLANDIGAYLAKHGRRTAQCKALIGCLAASDTPEARALLLLAGDSQKQKTARSHALGLLANLA